MKPKKIIYENQREIHDLIVKELKSNYLKNLEEAYLIGSLANGNFGVYEKLYEGYMGSDIDIVGIPTEILANWKYEGEYYDWHKRYNIGEIKILKILHPINLMVPFDEDINLFFETAKELKWKLEKLK